MGEDKAKKVTYIWKMTLRAPGNESLTYHGVGANTSVAVSKAKKKYKADMDYSSEKDDILVTNLEIVSEVQF